MLDKPERILHRLSEVLGMGIIALMLLVLYLFPDVARVFQVFLLYLVPIGMFIGLIAVLTGSLLMTAAGKVFTALYGAAMLGVAALMPSLIRLAEALPATILMVLAPLLAGVLLLLAAPFRRYWWI